MCTAAKPTQEDRTITVDFRDEATYFRLLEIGQAFVESVDHALRVLADEVGHTLRNHNGRGVGIGPNHIGHH
jgi:hypothetical protein